MKQPDPINLAHAVESALEQYFATLEDEQITNLHHLVIEQVEAPLIRYVLKRTCGNRTHAARILGINRNTLHRKITLYRIEIE
ncbi:MAG TPA: Fis family transcriptional regulator [Sulfurivirga caldicuralii]|nr:Fis family transcriptional regulator [Sulfurivirga caldicuralii]